MLGRIRRRADFVRATKSGLHEGAPGLVVQVYWRHPGGSEPGGTEPSEPRVGFTTSRKVGNAVKRNRARRRLRAIAEQELAPLARPGFDYVLVGRSRTLDRSFVDLAADVRRAVTRAHQKWQSRNTQVSE